MDKDSIEIAYFNRFHVPMTRGMRKYFCGLDYYDALRRSGSPNSIARYLQSVVGLETVRAELREIGVWSGRPLQESDLDLPEKCYARLALNAAHQIAIDEERALARNLLD